MVIQGRKFEEIFKIKSGFGPKDKDGNMMWNRCASHIPKLWETPIQELLAKVKSKYIYETVDMEEDDLSIDIYFDQIKEKFDELRIYWHCADKNKDKEEEIYQEIEQWINETKREIKSIDSNYGSYWEHYNFEEED